MCFCCTYVRFFLCISRQRVWIFWQVRAGVISSQLNKLIVHTVKDLFITKLSFGYKKHRSEHEKLALLMSELRSWDKQHLSHFCDNDILSHLFNLVNWLWQRVYMWNISVASALQALAVSLYIDKVLGINAYWHADSTAYVPHTVRCAIVHSPEFFRRWCGFTWK